MASFFGSQQAKLLGLKTIPLKRTLVMKMIAPKTKIDSPVIRQSVTRFWKAIVMAATCCAFTSAPVCAQSNAQNPSPKLAALPSAILNGPTLPTFKFELEKQSKRVFEGGTAAEAGATNFPVSEGIAGVSMYLKPGGLRELHWHANAAEWAYVIKGHCRITVIDPEGNVEVKDFGPGDVWYFPRGHGHSIQGIGDEECHFILVFDSGYFSEFATFSITDWIAHTPPEVLAKNFHVPASTFANFPKKEVYGMQGPVPGPLVSNPPSMSRQEPPLTHKFQLKAQKGQIFPGGTFQVASAKEFPISTTMTGALQTLEPNGLRELHWHPGANEWQYYISGHARMTVFGSSGRARTEEFGPGDVGYVPRGWGHYIENTSGSESCQTLIVLDSGTYEEISLSSWIKSTSPALLQTNFGVPKSIFESLPLNSDFISGGSKKP
jgi:oxalate decarboxylase